MADAAQKTFNPFSGTHAIVIEYDDIIRSPMLMVMEANKHNSKLSTLIDLQQIHFMYKYGMFEWYIHRHNRNPLQEFPALDELNDEIAYDVMKTFLQSDNHYISESRPLVFVDPLKVIISQKFTMEYFVYNEYSNPYVAQDMGNTFPGVSFKVLTGPFEEAIADVPFDATWVLSDITKLEALQKTGKLNLANIMVANDYRYNFAKDNPTKFVIDIDALREKSVFKFKLFNAASLTDEEKRHLDYLLRD